MNSVDAQRNKAQTTPRGSNRNPKTYVLIAALMTPRNAKKPGNKNMTVRSRSIVAQSRFGIKGDVKNGSTDTVTSHLELLVT